jgi:hypothetical protein
MSKRYYRRSTAILLTISLGWLASACDDLEEPSKPALEMSDTGEFPDQEDTSNDMASRDDAADEEPDFDQPDVSDTTCGSSIAQRSEEAARSHAVITEAVSLNPIDRTLTEETMGTLKLGLHEHAFPVLSGPAGVIAAASSLGQGRVVAFSGQEFLSSHERSTFLDITSVAQLVSNSVHWTAGQDNPSPRVLVDNEEIAGVLRRNGLEDVLVTPILLSQGLLETRDWRAESLAGFDVAVVQVNEWGTLRLGPTEIDALRAFVSNGGGLVIAGSALHWSWWLSESASTFIGNLILEGSGIGWNVDNIYDISNVETSFGALSLPEALWCAYIGDESVTADEMARLPAIFEAARLAERGDEVTVALDRMLLDTPPLPVAAASPEARLSANVAATLGPHPWPHVHPWTSTYPGLPTAASPGETLRPTVDKNWSGAQPLGAYAPPGEIVTVEVATEFTDAGLVLRVGELYDDLRHLDHIDTWQRAPVLVRHFPVTSSATEISNAFGGNISLVVPASWSNTVELTIDGAFPMMVHTRNISSTDDWQQGLDLGVPQVILQERGRVRMVVSTDEAKSVVDPDAVIDFWSAFHAHHAELAQEPSPRRFESHWIFDIQVGWGYANATSDRITYPKLSEAWALRTRTGDEDWWLFGHELGHQFQNDDWAGGDVTEVCVNLFTMYTLNKYIHGGGEKETIGFETNTIDHAALESARWATADLFGKLQLYRQLIFEFGWTPFISTFASYYDPLYPRSEYSGFMDGFAIRFSAIVERDLAGFFEHWEYPMSSQAAVKIRSFRHPEWLPPGW